MSNPYIARTDAFRTKLWRLEKALSYLNAAHFSGDLLLDLEESIEATKAAIERNNGKLNAWPFPSAAQISESERRAARRFDADATPLTGFDKL